jgi:Ca-activated chloride channel family protein
MRFWTWAVVISLLAVALPGCTGRRASSPGGGPAGRGEGEALAILSGSENKSLEPILQRFGRQNGVDVRVQYLGSVDIMLQLEGGAAGYDAVWPANSLWVDLGDQQKLVKHQASIMRSPVVFGVKRSVAQRLGWIGKKVTMEQILHAAEAGQLRFMMTSATQSNSGASAYLGYLYAFAGQPEILTQAHLHNPKVRDKVRRILGTVNRSAGSSGWLKDLFLQKYDQYDAMVNYEALVIEANQALVAQGREPLYAVYPADGLAIADSPLGYIDHGDATKEKRFLKLQEYLLSPDVQREIMGLGRRVGLAGMDTNAVDRRLFNPDWGIDVQAVLNPIRFPQAAVIREALDLYQSAFRKPSFTVYCLDFSGSMQGEGVQDLKAAMRLLLTPQESRRYLLQPSREDISVVIPFNQAPIDQWSVAGNSPQALGGLRERIEALPPGGGTDIYTPVIRAMELFRGKKDLGAYFPAVILMTDGKSNQGARMADLQARMQELALKADVPVFAVLFGDASEAQLKEIADYTSGRIFDGRKDLVQAFREARGYN